MTVYHDIPFRSARDQLINLLFQDASASKSQEGAFEPAQQIIANPLKDLPIFYNPTVTEGKPADLFILGGQKDTDYILCDKEDVPLKVKGAEINAQLLPLDDTMFHSLRACQAVSTATPTEIKIPDENDIDGMADFAETWKRVAQITTPEIKEDLTFHILARKTSGGLEEYLLSAVSVRVGIATNLQVQFVPQLATDILSEKADRITINFDQPNAAKLPLKIKILQTQEGVNYQVFEIIGEKRIERSDSVVGGSQGAEGDMSIELVTKGTFEEDTVLTIRAYRDDRNSTNPLLAADLTQKLTVTVRPNAYLEPRFALQNIAYNNSTTVDMDKTQDTVKYQLFVRPLELSEYSPDGALEIEAESIGNLAAFDQPRWGKPGEVLSLNTGLRLEDSVFVVQAMKNNGETLRLKKALVLLVQPDPSPTVSAASTTVSSGGDTSVILKRTQKGVKYQLGAGSKTIGEYGYHYSDRAIGGIAARREFGMRIGTDFKIGTTQDNADTLFDDQKLLLPTGPIKKTTTFKIKAKKSYTGLEADLSGTVDITVE